MDKDMIVRCIGNGLYHVVYRFTDKVQCYDCGNEIAANRYKPVNGTIDTVSDAVVSITDINGNIRLIRLEDIKRIEPYEESRDFNGGN